MNTDIPEDNQEMHLQSSDTLSGMPIQMAESTCQHRYGQTLLLGLAMSQNRCQQLHCVTHSPIHTYTHLALKTVGNTVTVVLKYDLKEKNTPVQWHVDNKCET